MIRTHLRTSTEGETRPLRLGFDHFGWGSLMAVAQRRGSSLNDCVSAACLAFWHHRDDQDYGARRLPRFKVSSELRVRLTLTLPAEAWAGLDAEAERQGVSLQQLVEHASIFALARFPDFASPPQGKPSAPIAANAGASRAHSVPLRRVGIAAAAAIFILPLLSVGLALAGLRLPGFIDRVSERVGLGLPNQEAPPAIPTPIIGPSVHSTKLDSPDRRLGAGNANDRRAQSGSSRTPSHTKAEPDKTPAAGTGASAAPPAAAEAPTDTTGSSPMEGTVDASEPAPNGAPDPTALSGQVHDAIDDLGGLINGLRGPPPGQSP